MATLLKHSHIVENDAWTILKEGLKEGLAEGAKEGLEVSEFTIVPLSFWQQNQSQLSDIATAGKLGLLLSSDQTADLIGENCRQFSLICIDFPKFIDGRGYSAARLLRERYGFTGELRAVGDVLIDQLFFMKRVGFDAFSLREDQDVEDALTAFTTFTHPYQGDVQDTRPLFRRHAG